MKEEAKSLAAVAEMMRMLSNESRLHILYALYDKPKTWTELIFEIKTNPKSLKHHLDYLKRNKLVTRNKPQGFKLTQAGKAFMELSIEDIVSTVRKAREIVARSDKTI